MTDEPTALLGFTDSASDQIVGLRHHTYWGKLDCA
jgi:hypothetical protein